MTSWTMPALLGAFHGLNPAMGWLFAVALGLQERRTAAVLRALPPIALGHAASITVVVALFAGLALVVPAYILQVGAAGVLFGFAAWLIGRRGRHKGRVGMRVGFRELTLWSFLMSSAHGAGLMLFPLLVHGSRMPAYEGPVVHQHAGHVVYAAGIGVLGVHTLAMFTAMTGVALAVFYFFGVNFLRRAWLNLDVVWVAALVVAGVFTLVWS
jgi:hypothetical protein